MNDTRVLPESITKALNSDGVRVSSKWAAILIAALTTLAIATSGWLWGLASERGTAIARLSEIERRLAANEQQVELLRQVSERMGRMETDLTWIKSAIQREERRQGVQQ